MTRGLPVGRLESPQDQNVRCWRREAKGLALNASPGPTSLVPCPVPRYASTSHASQLPRPPPRANYLCTGARVARLTPGAPCHLPNITLREGPYLRADPEDERQAGRQVPGLRRQGVPGDLGRPGRDLQGQRVLHHRLRQGRQGGAQGSRPGWPIREGVDEWAQGSRRPSRKANRRATPKGEAKWGESGRVNRRPTCRRRSRRAKPAGASGKPGSPTPRE